MRSMRPGVQTLLDFCLVSWEEIPEILRSAQDDDLVTGRWRFESRPFPQV